MDSLWDTFRRASTQVVEMLKEDLAEFNDQISNDTASFVAQTGDVLAATLDTTQQQDSPASKKSAEIRRSFSGTDYDSNDDEDLIVRGRDARLKKLQTDAAWYLEPLPDEDDFQAWRKEFDIKSKTEEISTLLMENESLRALHSQLIATTTYPTFWERYFYRVYTLKKEDQRRQALLARAEATQDESLTNWGWEDDDITISTPTTPIVEPAVKTAETPLSAIPADDDLLSGWEDDIDKEIQAEIETRSTSSTSLADPAPEASTNTKPQPSAPTAELDVVASSPPKTAAAPVETAPAVTTPGDEEDTDSWGTWE